MTSVTSKSSQAVQRIPVGPSDQFVKLEFQGQTEFPADPGYTLVMAWFSSDVFPPTVTAKALSKKVVDAERGTGTWNAAIEAALVFLLNPPLVKLQADRHDPDDPSDTTERHVAMAPFVNDLGFGYIALFNVKEGMVVSVEMAKDPVKAVDLNMRELKIITLVDKVKYVGNDT